MSAADLGSSFTCDVLSTAHPAV